MTTQMGQLQYTRNNEMKGRNFLSLAISMFLLSPGTVLAINDINNNEKLENRDELVSSQDVNNLDQDNEEIGRDELAKEFEDQSGIDSFENEDNGLVRYLASNYTRSGNYVVHGNDDNVYYAYNRVGSTFYLNNGGISTTYKKVREIIDTDTAVQTYVATTLFKEPAFSNKYRTNTTIPAGYYTAKYVAGSFVYVETDYGDGWISTSCDNNGNYISGGRMTFLDVPSSLSVGSVNGIPIYQKIIPRYSDDARAGYSMKPKYITIHNTASSGKGANARAHANLQYNGNNRTASWHYTVDNTEIWQSIPINENSWHAGDGQAMGNCGSVSIEICENSDGNYAQAERNAAYLAARLLYECGLPSDAIRMHRDWSGKNCPHNTIEGTKGTMGWESFKSLVVSAYNSYAQNDRNTSNVVNQGTGKASNAPTIQYNAKTQKIGWQNQVTEPNSTGTTGRSLKLYQLKMNLLNVPYSTHLYGTIKTTAGQKNYDNIENDTLIGIDGKAMTQVNFGLENVPGYHLEYRVHSSNLGWQSWVKQGNKAGDGNNEIQAIDFKLVKDDDIKVTAPKIYYNGHIADKGWLNYVPDSQIGGTVGKSIYLQAFHLGIDNAEEYNLSGKVYVDGKGWQNYDEINPNTVLGTTGQNKAIKAINLNLDLPGYRLEYQVHSSNIGWQNWVKSGQIAGDEKNNIEAIRFRLVEDNSKILQIAFDKNELYMNLNSIYQLKSRIIPENTVMDKTLSWESDNEEVAKVDQNGNITANKVGVAIITATSVNGLTASCKINVIKPITSIKLDNADITIEKNKEITLGLSIEPMDATESYTWTSSNTNVATVDENGKVKAVGGGDTTITVKSKNRKEAKCQIHVLSHIDSVTLNKKELKIEKTNSETLQATINPSDATDDKTLTWKSEDENIAKVDGNGKVTGVGTGTTNITVTTSNGKSAACKVTVVRQTPSVNYSTHVQDIGWQGYVKDGSTAGTTGQSKRLEAIRIKLSNNTSYKGTIQYQTHIQDIGWQGWKMNDEMSGTSGQSKRLEAIRIKLTDELAENYDIYYRVHAQEFGWLGWAKNGESAGTAGYSYRLEAIEVKLVEKGGKAPGSTQDAYRQRYVSYQTHVQDIGWQGIKYDGEEAGTSGQSKRLEAINISLSNPLYSGSIEYQTHVQDIGWQGWKANGQMAGTSGQSKRLEAIRIKLTGEMAKQYDIYYRVHSQEFGWLGWAKNGESAGTEGYSYRLEAIQIQLVKKGSSAPGSTSNCFYKR